MNRDRGDAETLSSEDKDPEEDFGRELLQGRKLQDCSDGELAFILSLTRFAHRLLSGDVSRFNPFRIFIERGLERLHRAKTGESLSSKRMDPVKLNEKKQNALQQIENFGLQLIEEMQRRGLEIPEIETEIIEKEEER